MITALLANKEQQHVNTQTVQKLLWKKVGFESCFEFQY